ncbi:hypothetical protein RFI_21010 [Reticulomyxa filosa]|uniref:Uncharacterized protein n=1 Tax=Reticulomyxa filosa TaxID=46433 RepID=X6MSB9_RETFI|nr:hypothetical protein RFI_21010 [Reticulomyxa filosa]|eukprot:ETO16342.1 hypothetical protein RFI_21010 [Reticulomyxa filosa]
MICGYHVLDIFSDGTAVSPLLVEETAANENKDESTQSTRERLPTPNVLEGSVSASSSRYGSDHQHLRDAVFSSTPKTITDKIKDNRVLSPATPLTQKQTMEGPNSIQKSNNTNENNQRLVIPSPPPLPPPSQKKNKNMFLLSIIIINDIIKIYIPCVVFVLCNTLKSGKIKRVRSIDVLAKMALSPNTKSVKSPKLLLDQVLTMEQRNASIWNDKDMFNNNNNDNLSAKATTPLKQHREQLTTDITNDLSSQSQRQNTREGLVLAQPTAWQWNE